MKKKSVRMFSVVLTMLLLTVTAFEMDAFARAGGGRSFGTRGTRSYSPPTRTYSPPATPAPSPYRAAPYQPPAGGGFFRNFAGGMLGGLVGGMLFRSLGFGGGGMGGSGIGLFEIILLAGIGYFIYRMIRKKRQESENFPYSAPSPGDYNQPAGYQQEHPPAYQPAGGDLESGIAHIRQMDYGFDETRFKDTVMDIFFKIQGAWMGRDLAPVTSLLGEEVRRAFQDDIDRLLREKRINRLENIAVRSVDLTEAWQEAGQDYITVRFYANLLDYTTDEGGTVIEGSKTDPVKFEEFWTFTRPVGSNPWRLSAVDQA